MLGRWLCRRGRWLCLGFGAAAVPWLLAGCESCSRPPLVGHGANGGALASHVEPGPPPLGTYVNGWASAQAAKAEADDFVIYGYEWYQQGATPGPWGSAHLKRIAKRLPNEPFPVVIESCETDPAINVARRDYVVRFLHEAGIGDAELRVVVGGADNGHLYGDEIEPIYQQFIQRNNNNNGYGGALGGGFRGGVPGFGTPPLVPQVPYGGFGGIGGFGR